MPQAIKGKFPELSKIVFELRYRNGYTYLDRCGRTINLIQEYFPDWIVGGAAGPTPSSTSLINVETRSKFSFSSQKLDVHTDTPIPPAGETRKGFSEEVEELTSIVIDQLGLADFTRIGFRAWYLFGADSQADAQQYIDSLDFFSINPKLIEAFKGKVEQTSMSVVIDGEDRRFRISAEVVERAFELDLGDASINVPVHALPSNERKEALLKRWRERKLRQTHPPSAASLDIDCFRHDPQIIKPGEFVTTSMELGLEAFRKAANIG